MGGAARGRITRGVSPEVLAPEGAVALADRPLAFVRLSRGPDTTDTRGLSLRAEASGDA